MANTNNTKPSTENDKKSNKIAGKQKTDKTNENVLESNVTETEAERGFKEGLANNSDTEKNSRQQK